MLVTESCVYWFSCTLSAFSRLVSMCKNVLTLNVHSRAQRPHEWQLTEAADRWRCSPALGAA